MTVQVRRATQADLFFAGLGMVMGVGAALAAYGAWLMITGGSGIAALLPVEPLMAREAAVMGLPLAAGAKAYWFVARAGGVIAYLLLWLATLWGILMSSRMVRGWVDASLLFGMHEYLPVLAILFTAVHALVLLGDTYVGFHLADLLVPFVASYRPVWTGLGILAFYLSAALIASFYLRSVIGRRGWRAFHYGSYLAFGLAMAHGLMAGTDSAVPVVKWMYGVTGATLLFATLYRILAREPKSGSLSLSAHKGPEANRQRGIAHHDRTSRPDHHEHRRP